MGCISPKTCHRRAASGLVFTVFWGLGPGLESLGLSGSGCVGLRVGSSMEQDFEFRDV